MLSDSAMQPDGLVLGVFVGGRGSRMGGRDKASLPAPGSGEPLAARLCRLGKALGLSPVLVGDSAADVVLDGVAVPRVHDAPAGIGPLGGLSALLAHAGERAALAVACDLPHVTAALLARLAEDPREAPVLAPRDPASGKWQPLCARYAAPRVRPVLAAALDDGVRSFQALLARLDVAELTLDATEHAQLADWDTPDDIAR